MERSQFEKEIQQKFLNREITPSVDLWDKLETKLPGKSNSKGFHNYFYGLAAAVAITVFFVFYNPMQKSVNQIEPYNIPVTGIEKPINDSLDEPGKYTKTNIENNEKTVTDIDKGNLEASGDRQPVNNAMVQTNGNSHMEVKETLKPLAALADNDSGEIRALVSVLEEAKKIESLHGEVTEEEIAQLIFSAQHKLKQDNPVQANKTSGAALALLEDVEEELDRSFKDKVFKLLKKGLVKVKTAVAERNE